MEFSSTTLLVLAILFLSTFIRSALGFGDALIAMPLLAIVVGLQVATPLTAMGATTIATIILIKAWKKVDMQAAWRLVITTWIGIPIGIYFLKAAPEVLVKSLLGIIITGFGLYNLIVPNLPRLLNENWAYLTGLIAGILGGAYNTNGPPVVIYGMLRRWDSEKFRATLQGYFLPTGAAILISHGIAGMWTPQVVHLYLYSIPVIIGAVLIGGKVNQLIPQGKFDKVIYGFLVIIGILLIIKG
ncbi:MAG: sulfite exporter TauE/SafE family protein [Anaerolineales bacterium]|nr:sulfite exporter TauE/SafE family protein [Anaerolineales bacterium]